MARILSILLVVAAGCGDELPQRSPEELSLGLRVAESSAWIMQLVENIGGHAVTFEATPSATEQAVLQAVIARAESSPALMRCLQIDPRLGDSQVNFVLGSCRLAAIIGITATLQLTAEATDDSLTVTWALAEPGLSLRGEVLLGEMTRTFYRDDKQTTGAFRVQSLLATLPLQGQIDYSLRFPAEDCVTVDALAFAQTPDARVSFGLTGMAYCSGECPRGEMAVAAGHLQELIYNGTPTVRHFLDGVEQLPLTISCDGSRATVTPAPTPRAAATPVPTPEPTSTANPG